MAHNRKTVQHSCPPPANDLLPPGTRCEIVYAPMCWVGKIGTLLALGPRGALLSVAAEDGGRALTYRVWFPVSAVQPLSAEKVAA